MTKTAIISGRWTRFLAVAAFSFRLLALFPVLFAGQSLTPDSGIVVSHAGGDQELPVSGPHQVGLVAAACALAAGGEMLLPTAAAVPLPRGAALGSDSNQTAVPPGGLALAFYQARAPPRPIG